MRSAARVVYLVFGVVALLGCAPAADGAARSTDEAGLQGTWRLSGYEVWDERGQRQAAGGTTAGYLVLDATGHAFVQLLSAEGTDFGAYFGTYTVDSEAALLRIEVEGSNIPDYRGSTQIRPYHLAGNILVLGVEGEYRAIFRRVARR